MLNFPHPSHPLLQCQNQSSHPYFLISGISKRRGSISKSTIWPVARRGIRRKLCSRHRFNTLVKSTRSLSNLRQHILPLHMRLRMGKVVHRSFGFVKRLRLLAGCSLSSWILSRVGPFIPSRPSRKRLLGNSGRHLLHYTGRITSTGI